uniref:Uncharacterized protein n=1 Tax=Siphoviridae sp. ctss15 TaxID=2825699 RepID=A0A8S5TRE5_9CAUD|nr:MAG TPA: hypothetical protein [Siphoviridae sp. ctss15]
MPTEKGYTKTSPPIKAAFAMSFGDFIVIRFRGSVKCDFSCL